MQLLYFQGLAIAAMWQQVLGVNVILVNQELKAFLDSGQRGDFDIRLNTWGADYNSVTTYLQLYQCGNGNNFGQYCNQKYEALITSMQQTINLNKQYKIYLITKWIVIILMVHKVNGLA